MEILVVLVLFVLALFFINRWQRGKEIGGRISNTINTLGKIQSLISLFKSYLTEDALRNDEDVAYYLSYLQGVVEELCKYDQQKCDLVQMTPIYQEVHRLGCLESDQIFEEGREVLLRLIKTPDGQQGLEDGMSDGAYMANPKNPAPYFGNLISRFNIQTAYQKQRTNLVENSCFPNKGARMKNLSVRQKVYWVFAASVALAVIALLFPPFYIQVQGNVVGLGHGFYFSRSGTGGRVDTGLLLMIWFAIFSIGALIAGFLVLNSMLPTDKKDAD